MRPATAEEAPYIEQLVESLRGERLSRVTYVYPEFWTRTTENESDLIDEVDMDVVLHFIGGGHLKISWAMDGLIEGLALSRDDLPSQDLSHLDVSSSPNWAHLIGGELKEARVLWHPANAGVPDSIWWMGFTFGSGVSFSVVLGEMRDGVADYQPDSLLVFFDELRDFEFRKRMGRYWP